ncbi:hypothetical protein [Mycolicibacterium canariasense]|uniref:hypothetical protein n=1 Tax=Mycolicibacterium canariasense TaxID=228230 RepID=UPI001041E4FC|nr:hypothetical protein [Mycolicibacterium canariasense]MCV7211729.1 hypothetical protein [Mycolicibacterium canariasense]
MTADELAWRLADLLPPVLPDMDRHAIYVALGCRHFRSAITLSLRAVIKHRLGLPAVMIDDLHTWMAVLHDDGERASLQALLQMVIQREAARTIPPLAPSRRPQVGRAPADAGVQSHHHR